MCVIYVCLCVLGCCGCCTLLAVCMSHICMYDHDHYHYDRIDWAFRIQHTIHYNIPTPQHTLCHTTHINPPHITPPLLQVCRSPKAVACSPTAQPTLVKAAKKWVPMDAGIAGPPSRAPPLVGQSTGKRHGGKRVTGRVPRKWGPLKREPRQMEAHGGRAGRRC